MDTYVEPNSDRAHLCLRCGLGLHPDAVVCPRCGADVPEFQGAPPEFGPEPATPSYESPSAFDPGPLGEGDPQPEEEPMAPHLASAGAIAAEPLSSSYLQDLESSPAGVPNVAATPEPPVGDHTATREWEAIPAGFDVPAAEEPHADVPAPPASDATDAKPNDPPPASGEVTLAEDLDRQPEARA